MFNLKKITSDNALSISFLFLRFVIDPPDVFFCKNLPSGSPKGSVVLNAQILLAADTCESDLPDASISERYHVEAPEGYPNEPCACLPTTLLISTTSRASPTRGQACAKKNEIKPWRHEMWVIPPGQNTDFVCQMEQVLEVYKRPTNPSGQ